MTSDDIYSPGRSRSQRPFSEARARAKTIDQEGREIPDAPFNPQFDGFRFDFGNGTANPFGNLTREQRLARIEAIAKLLDVAFVVPGTNIRYGIDGLIGLVPVVGDLITTAISLWLVRGPRARRALAHHGADAGERRAGWRGRHCADRGRRFRRHVPRQCAQCPDAQALDGEAAV